MPVKGIKGRCTHTHTHTHSRTRTHTHARTRTNARALADSWKGPCSRRRRVAVAVSGYLAETHMTETRQRKKQRRERKREERECVWERERERETVEVSVAAACPWAFFRSWLSLVLQTSFLLLLLLFFLFFVFFFFFCFGGLQVNHVQSSQKVGFVLLILLRFSSEKICRFDETSSQSSQDFWVTKNVRPEPVRICTLRRRRVASHDEKNYFFVVLGKNRRRWVHSAKVVRWHFCLFFIKSRHYYS